MAWRGRQSTHLLLGDRIVHQHEVRQQRKASQHVEVGQLGQLVGGQHQVAQVGDRARQRGLYARDAVARQQQRRDARRQREVAEEGDVVVGEVDRVVGLDAEGISSQGRRRGREGKSKEKKVRLTPAAPRFSMAGI